MRKRIRFLGRVQGVGFRATARGIVRRSGPGVTGWVRNEPDGSVVMVVEGDEGDVGRVLEELRATMRGFITGEREEAAEMGEAYERFEVRR
ncbi:MAG: acylphosphatase [Phycisphaerales bacterium]